MGKLGLRSAGERPRGSAWTPTDMMPLVRTTLVSALGIVLVASCAHHPVRAPSLAPKPASDSEVDDKLEAKLAELEHADDWRSTVWATGMPNPAIAARARQMGGSRT